MNEETNKLTSLDYADLAQYVATKFHGLILNKTKINKILYYAYGVYLADYGEKMFDDDQMQAWTYGPVFPNVYLNHKIEAVTDKEIDEERKEKFRQNRNAMVVIQNAVDKLYRYSATQLMNWTHKEGSPWYKTIFDDKNSFGINPFGTPISDDYVKNFFKDENNREVKL